MSRKQGKRCAVRARQVPFTFVKEFLEDVLSEMGALLNT
jgi:hypothetical protein